MHSDDVIPGPRFPTWACTSCTRGSTNWASGVACACGKRAPDKVRAAALRNAYDTADEDGGKAKGKGASRSPKGKLPVDGRPRGSGRKGSDNLHPPWSELHTMADRIRQLESERRPNQTSKPATFDPRQAEGELEEESADVIRSQISELEGIVKSSSNESLRQHAACQLEVLKTKLLEKKTPEDRQSAALWKLKKAKLKRTRLLEQLVESKAAVLAAQAAHLELEAKGKAADAEVATFELQLAEASAASFPASLPVAAINTEITISDEALAHSEHGAEIKSWLASPAYATMLKLRDIAKQEADALGLALPVGPAASGDGALDVVFSDSNTESWYDFGGETDFFSEDAFNKFKATATRKDFTDMAHQMGFGCKKARISKAEPY